MIDKESILRAIEITKEAINITSSEGKMIYANAAMEELFGYDKGQLLGRSPAVLNAADHPVEVVKKIMDTIAKNGSWRGEVHNKRKDGSEFFTYAIVSAVKNKHGEILHFISTQHDITELKAMRQTLKGSEEKFRDLTEVTTDWMWEVDQNGVYSYSNPKIKDLLGYEADEILGKTPFDLMPKEEAEKVAKIFKDKISKREPFSGLENINRHKDGRRVVLETSAIPIIDPQGQFKGYRGIDRDITQRKNAEASLKESEERHRTLVKNVDVGIYRNSADPDGRFIEANPAMVKMFGYDSAEEFMRLRVTDLYQNSQDRKSFLAQVKQQGFVKDRELQLQRKGGMPIWAACTARAHYDKNGNIQWMDGVITDITKRKEIEKEKDQALNELQQRMKEQACFYGLSDIVEIPGVSLEEIFQSMANNLPEGFRHPEITFARITLDDKEFKSENFKESDIVISVPVKIEESSVGVIEIYCLDDPRLSGPEGAFLTEEVALIEAVAGRLGRIAERRQAQEELKLAAEEWQRTFDSISDLVFIQDTNYTIIKANKAFYQAVKSKPEDIIGRKCYDVLHVRDTPWSGCPFEQTLKDNKAHTEEVDDPVIGLPLLVSTSPIFNEANEMTASVHIAKDITQQKKTAQELKDKNEALKRLDQLKSDFISVVSHELRTPLTPIRESVSLIHDGILGEINDQQKRSLSIGLRNIDRLTRLINDLLDTSKIEAGRLELDKEPLDIKALVQTVIETFSSQAQSKSLQLKTEFPKGPIEIYADRDKTIQVFTNLVGNALKFTEKGNVTISVEDRGEYAQCAITDTGRGIAEIDLPKVFNKFQQFGRASDTRERGTGLGLTISKGIVELQGGRIRVESQLGEGTSFIFTLVKYNKDKVFSEKIAERLARAAQINEEFCIWLAKINNYDRMKKKLGQAMTEDILQKISQALGDVVHRRGDVLKRAEEEIFVAAEIAKDGLTAMNKRLKRALKEVIFEFKEAFPIDFSYGYAGYPGDGAGSDELLEIVADSLVNDKKERLASSIMIVDDEPGIIAGLKRLLQEAGYTNFTEALDGETALDKINTSVPELVILDMKMPKMSGYEVVGRLKENVRTKDIPILIMSGYKVEIDRLDDYMKEKAIPIIGKPFDQEQVKDLVDYLL